VTKICETLNISRSGYYKYKNRVKPEKEKQDELICSLITEYHLTFDGILGYRRMTMFINKLNQKSFSKGYIHRLMRFLVKSKLVCNFPRSSVNPLTHPHVNIRVTITVKIPNV
jgi:putative transposase